MTDERSVVRVSSFGARIFGGGPAGALLLHAGPAFPQTAQTAKQPRESKSS